MSVNPGDLDREIVLLSATPTQEPSSGEEVLTWPDVASPEGAAGVAGAVVVWAQWIPGTTRESWLAQQRLGSSVDGIFRIYDVSPRPTAAGTRILFEGRTYDVKPVIEEGRGESLLIPVVARGE